MYGSLTTTVQYTFLLKLILLIRNVKGSHGGMFTRIFFNINLKFAMNLNAFSATILSVFQKSQLGQTRLGPGMKIY